MDIMFSIDTQLQTQGLSLSPEILQEILQSLELQHKLPNHSDRASIEITQNPKEFEASSTKLSNLLVLNTKTLREKLFRMVLNVAGGQTLDLIHKQEISVGIVASILSFLYEFKGLAAVTLSDLDAKVILSTMPLGTLFSVNQIENQFKKMFNTSIQSTELQAVLQRLITLKCFKQIGKNYCLLETVSVTKKIL
jgi:hypothetical protein